LSNPIQDTTKVALTFRLSGRVEVYENNAPAGHAGADIGVYLQRGLEGYGAGFANRYERFGDVYEWTYGSSGFDSVDVDSGRAPRVFEFSGRLTREMWLLRRSGPTGDDINYGVFGIQLAASAGAEGGEGIADAEHTLGLVGVHDVATGENLSDRILLGSGMPVPEPSLLLLLLGVGAASLLAYVIRRPKRAP
jgi:hypothetical protein